MALDWGIIGAGLASMASGFFGWVAGKSGRQADNAAKDAETELYTTLRTEISALHDEIVKLRRYVSRLERALREGGLELPPIEIGDE